MKKFTSLDGAEYEDEKWTMNIMCQQVTNEMKGTCTSSLRSIETKEDKTVVVKVKKIST